MSTSGQNNQKPKHPYLAGNFAPVAKTWTPTPLTWSGEIPRELYGGMYVRNGGNPVTNSDLGREAHWFDGDGMLSGVWFEQSHTYARQPVVNFVNQFVFTDVYLSAAANPNLRTPILPSISTLVNPASKLLFIIWRIVRTILIVILSWLPGSQLAIKRISVANTGILYHDGRALATCESGPPMRVTLPELETVGWFDGNSVQGETSTGSATKGAKKKEGFGGSGPLSWMREWTTGHPKVDNATGEMILFHCNFAPPYVHYSVVPTDLSQDSEGRLDTRKVLNAPVPGCTGGKLMHDFGVSKRSAVILDLPLTLTPFNLARNRPVVSYEPERPARFGVFPRHEPNMIRWFETSGCCIFHTANTWDEVDASGNVSAVNMLACRLTSASLVFSAANIEPPPHPSHSKAERLKRTSSFASFRGKKELEDVEKTIINETSPLLAQSTSRPSRRISGIPISDDDEEQCRLYYYRFSLSPATPNIVTHQFALSAIAFEFPTVSPLTDMTHARYIYGCSTSIESFGAALGKATKIDVLVRIDVHALLARANEFEPEPMIGCVDARTMDEILASTDPNDPIKAFKLPPKQYGQEARFVPRQTPSNLREEQGIFLEESGYLLFYVFNEEQLDASGECTPDAKSELWVLDASTMQDVVCKIHLPTRIPYGLHGNWFTEEQIKSQRGVAEMRSMPQVQEDGGWNRVRSRLVSCLG
ncbi:carotenoid oxygenase [Pyrenochaeta sp. DS3sAY3a]|nr:carotenoid oxygenase [Pyrenochaeta sp. DS3sAY3a]